VSAAAAQQASGWIAVPEPDVAVLEPAVAEQLTGLVSLVEDLAANPEVPAPKLGEAFGDLAQHYHAYGLAQVAEESYGIAARLAPEDFRWPYLQAYLLESAGRLEEAVALYERALGLDPDVPPALIRLGKAYLTLNRTDEARLVLERALALSQGSPAAAAAMGELLLSERRYREAADRLELALDRQPQANRLYYPLALAYRGLGDLDRAQELLALRGQVGVRPADPLVDGLSALTTGERVHLLRGRAAFDVRQYETAAAEFALALEADPNSIRARLNLAAALAEIDRIDEAIGHLEKVIELAPGNATAHFNLALLYQRQGQDGPALERLKDAVLYEPRDAEMQLSLANALRAAGKLDEALGAYGKAVAINPASEFAWVGEADVLARLGRFEEALNRLETGHSLMPVSGAIAHGLARMLAACPDASLRDGPRAVSLAESVFKARPTLPHLKTLAMAHAESDACDVAAQWIARGVESVEESGIGENPDDLLALGARYQAGPPCRPPALDQPDG
jgi:tetratricopeptide (TPR) repeat protein